MILNTIKPTIESSGNFKENFFSIGDLGMVFDILRNKLYSNPISSICREVASNAVDAHREVGKAEHPIQITLPTAFEPWYKIKDWGPGISPDRMENIFVKFGSSSKRGSNTQVGGFGIGAKVPLAYTDTFTIETIVDGTKYNYACVIDETQVGKIVLLSKISTDDPNGTEIIIEVKGQDFRSFAEHTQAVCRHWKVKPIIKNDTGWKWEEIKPAVSGANWMITDGLYDDYRSVGLIIDEIEYPLDVHQLKSFKNQEFWNSLNGTLYLLFKTGELSLSANRETVHLDAPTQAKIVATLNSVIGEIKSSIEKRISQCASYYEANCLWAETIQPEFNSTNFLKPLSWQGAELLYNGIKLDYYNDKAIIIEFCRESGTTQTFRSTKYSMRILDKALFYFNDLDVKTIEINTNLIKPLFANNPTVEHICILSAYHHESIPSFDALDKKLHLTELGTQKLSTVDLTLPKKRKASTSTRLLVFKFVNGAFRMLPAAEVENDAADKVLCPLKRDEWNGERSSLYNALCIRNDLFTNLANLSPKTSFYGVDEKIPEARIKEVFPKAQTFVDFVDKIFGADSKLDMEQIQVACTNYNFPKTAMIELFEKKKDLFINKKSLFVRYHNAIAKLLEVRNKYGALYNAYTSLGKTVPTKAIQAWYKKNPELDADLLRLNVESTYPLINSLDYYSKNNLSPAFIQYINLIDTAQGASKCKQK
jgi:hypothetical protein